MTTIAYKDGVLASDSRLSDDTGHIWSHHCKKIWRLKDGSLVGFSGDDEAGTLILQSLQRGLSALPSLSNDVEVCGLRVMPDGTIWITEGHAWRAWEDSFAAIGSGQPYAMTVLRAGGSAYEAVKAGIESNCFSGGAIQTLRLKKGRA